MRFHIIGKFNGDEASLPQRKHPVNYVPVNEPSMEKVAKISKEWGLITILVLSVLVFVLTKSSFDDFSIGFFIGAILSQLTMLPHEFLHAICFKEDASMYTNFKQNLIIVVGTEDMSKVRVIIMYLLPNVIFGLIPFMFFLFNNSLIWCGILGAFCIGMGMADYLNVLNMLKQVPKGAKVYQSGFHSYWYIKE